MKLGFYYHIPFAVKDKKIFLPGYLGIYVDALASKVDKLIFVGNQTAFDPSHHDYALTSDNIEYIDMGAKSHAVLRTLFGWFSLMPFRKKILQSCDHLLVRCPSPLAPWFKLIFGRKLKVGFLVVGDYREGANHLQGKGLKMQLLKLFYIYNDYKLTRAIKGTPIFTNSVKLKQRYDNIAGKIQVVSTATINPEDYFEREDTCTAATKTILYVGRYDFAKGLKELLEAFLELSKSRNDIQLKISGWDDSRNQDVINYMHKFVAKNNLNDKVFITGKLKYGLELNEAYRTSDIFVMPSHHEGFPRAIYEAMANSLPVIATKVGSIPFNLSDGNDCVLIDPKNVAQLVQSIQLLLTEEHLRKKIILNGYNKAKQLELNKQVLKIINNL